MHAHPSPGARGVPKAVAGAAVIWIMLHVGGCGFLVHDKIHHVVDPAQQPTARCELQQAAPPLDRIVGVALSGGGSRAALFAAATLEALAEHGALAQVSHISSVSGGSIAAAYYLAYPPECGVSGTTQEERACRRAYFADFKQQMRVNYQIGMFRRNLQPWRFSSPTRRAISLQEEFDDHFLNGKTFGDLGPHPTLLINATSYDETRRFVFSNTCLPEGPSVVTSVAPTPNASSVLAEKALAQRALQAFSFSRPDCIRPVPNDLPVSLSVVASAAFPPLSGPISIQSTTGCNDGARQWWHLGDGGVIENSGTDSLEEVLLRRLTIESPPLQSALFLSVDAGLHPDPDKLKSRKNFKMNTSPTLAGLVVDSPRVRGQAYHNIFWDELLTELEREGIGYEKITFTHTEAMLDERPTSCLTKVPADKVREHLGDIPTKFKVDRCDADLLELAAHQLVHDTFDDATVQRLRGAGFTLAVREPCAMSQ